MWSCGAQNSPFRRFRGPDILPGAVSSQFSEIRPEPVYPPLGFVSSRDNYEELRTNVPRCNGRFVLVVVAACCSQSVAISSSEMSSSPSRFCIASGRCINALQISSRRLGLHESPPSLSPQCGTICVRGASRPCFSAAEDLTSISQLVENLACLSPSLGQQYTPKNRDFVNQVRAFDDRCAVAHDVRADGNGSCSLA